MGIDNVLHITFKEEVEVNTIIENLDIEQDIRVNRKQDSISGDSIQNNVINIKIERNLNFFLYEVYIDIFQDLNIENSNKI